MPSLLESLIEAVNVQLEAGQWANVAMLTVELCTVAVAAGETEFAELVQDLHWIANDALARPLVVEELVQA